MSGTTSFAEPAPFKVIVNEVPLMQFYALPYDRWEGYAVERKQVVEGLRGVKNVIETVARVPSRTVAVRDFVFCASEAFAWASSYCSCGVSEPFARLRSSPAMVVRSLMMSRSRTLACRCRS